MLPKLDRHHLCLCIVTGGVLLVAACDLFGLPSHYITGLALATNLIWIWS